MELKARLKYACMQTALKLSNPNEVAEVSFKRENTFFAGVCSPWDSLTLGYGYPGLVLLFAEMIHFNSDPIWSAAARKYVDLLIGELKEKGCSNLSLFGGLSGICFSVYILSLQDPAYSSLHFRLHSRLLSELQRYLSVLSPRTTKLLPLEYGVMTGISGILAYLLQFKEMKSLTEQFLARIVHLANPSFERCREVPGWLAPPHYLLPDQVKNLHSEETNQKFLSAYANGCFDTGIAHGIAGCLAILSKATEQGIQIPGQIEAMKKISDWLMAMQQRVGQIEGVWPKRFAYHPLRDHFYEIVSEEYFDGWSYGSPGILHALMMSAQTTNDETLAAFCLKEMSQTTQRMLQSSSICPSFFYGLAGPLTIFNQWASFFSSGASQIAKVIVDQFDDKNCFGFKCSPPSYELNDSKVIDNASLLTGSAGIVLALTQLSTVEKRPWTQIFLFN